MLCSIVKRNKQKSFVFYSLQNIYIFLSKIFHKICSENCFFPKETNRIVKHFISAATHLLMQDFFLLSVYWHMYALYVSLPICFCLRLCLLYAFSYYFAPTLCNYFPLLREEKDCMEEILKNVLSYYRKSVLSVNFAM